MVNWQCELLYLSPNEQYVRFLQILRPLIEKFVPAISLTQDRSPPWTLNPPRHMLRRRNQAWDNFKTVRGSCGRQDARTDQAWQNFACANSAIKNFALNSQIQYEREISQQLAVTPKLFHSYVRHKRVSRPSIGPLRLSDGTLTDDPLAMANTFAYSFASVFDASVPSVQHPHHVSSSTIPRLEITQEMIVTTIQSIDRSSSPGSDNVHPRLLKELLNDIAEPLQIIFDNSLCTGLLPRLWTDSTIVPIFKKSSRFDPLNYRPVALTSVVCKVMERVLASALWDYIEENNLISEEQFGFRAEHSTVDQLLLTYEEVTKLYDAGSIIDLIFFDYSKAFDRVSHPIILAKLQCLGITGDMLNWIRSFLCRSMKVRVAGQHSRPTSVESGVPQGSVLGPVLFLLYINHVVSELSCSCKIFADDIKIYLGFPVSDEAVASNLLQRNVDMLVMTSASWNLSINSSKCAVVRFSHRNCSLPFSGESPYNVNGSPIIFSEIHADLGIRIERSLKFHHHIRSRVNVAGALTTNLLSSTKCRDQDFILNIYISHIRPQLEYGSPLWNMGYVGDLKLVERIQRRWTRAITSIEHLSYGERLRQLDLYSMYGRLLRADLILTWKIFNNKCAIKPADLFKPSLSQITRGHSKKIQVERFRLDIRKRFFSVRVVPVWNSLSNDAVTAKTIQSFKALLHRELSEELYRYF